MQRRVPTRVPTMLVLVLVGGATPAWAQNALGDGTALDRNLQKGSGGKNSKGRDLETQIRYQNAVITGNAPDGKSFRGNAGYRAPGEFLGNLGSNDLYNFRRDTALSNTVAQGISGTDALRYQFSLTTGQATPSPMTGSLTVQRSGAGVNGSNIAAALRSTGEFRTQQSLKPTVIAYIPETTRTGSTTESTEKSGGAAAVASPLLGVRTFKLPALDTGLTPKPEDEKIVSPLSGLETTIRGATRPGQFSNQVKTAAPTGKLESEPEAKPMGDALEPFRRPPQGAKSTEAKPGAEPNAKPEGQDQNPVPPKPPDDWQKRLEELRKQLKDDTRDPTKAPAPDSAQRPGASVDPAAPKELTDAQRKAKLEQRRLLTLKSLGLNPDGSPVDVNAKTVDDLRQTRITVRSLMPAPVDNVAYVEHMADGQGAMAQGRYFDAEDGFMRAMAAAPGDAMANVGRIHAQLAAGLYVSASTNLRILLGEHPELIPVRYAPALLPPKERCDSIAGQLRARLGDEQSGLAREASLLLAYMGYQTGDSKVLADGLEAFSRFADPQRMSDRALLQVIESVWSRPSEPTDLPGVPPPDPADKK